MQTKTRRGQKYFGMTGAQVAILIIMGIAICGILGVGGLLSLRGMSTQSPVPVSDIHPIQQATLATTTPVSKATLSPPKAQSVGGQSETVRHVESLLKGLGYNIIGVKATTVSGAGTTLAVYIMAPYVGARNTLIDITSLVSPYAAMARPPFDYVSVVIYSQDNKPIIVSLVEYKDIKAWLNEEISGNEFITKWTIKEP